MKIRRIALHPYEIFLTTGVARSGVLLEIIDDVGNRGWGDVAPLPFWSKESLEECLKQLKQKELEIQNILWMSTTLWEELLALSLLPALSFALESALLAILEPLDKYSISPSALLMGSKEEILTLAKFRKEEGFTSAKLKISQLQFEEARELIHQLKEDFSLRIDVNRAWSTKDSLNFFSQFSLDAFDYVEEPFRNPRDLKNFTHPLAVDESFPQDLSLSDLEELPTLKALVYKPTIQGGILHLLPLQKWAKEKGIGIVLSSSFESDIGLSLVASIACRLEIEAPIGIGTYHYIERKLSEAFSATDLRFVNTTLSPDFAK